MNARRIGVLTGGGDCAGLNSAVKWVVKTALDERLRRERETFYQVLGIRYGWEGLVQASTNDKYIQPLDAAVVRTWDRYGGTFLGASRTNPYDPANDQSARVLENIQRLGLDALVAIGGEDTLSVANRLSAEGINVVGIPKTIDRDLPMTDYCLGFDSALNVIVEEVDRLRTTAGSHRRTFIVETMGRTAGWLALAGGEASGAYIILIPEHEFSIQKVSDLILEARNAGARYDIVIVAEGARPSGMSHSLKAEVPDGFGHRPFGGIASYLAGEIGAHTGLDCRSVVLSHLQRGGSPSAYDRRMGRYFGITAVDSIVAEEFGRMVSYTNGRIVTVPLRECVGHPVNVDVDTMYDADRYNGRRTILRAIRPTSQRG